jgi:hypothetical protein
VEFVAKELTEILADFAAGVNSDPSPLLLPPNQLADARNVTVRGTFATHRPYLRKITLNYGSVPMQTAFESGLFQAACHFKPDVGTEDLMAAVSGRLFQFNIGINSANVTEATIPGDPNPAFITQSWMWQAEKWIIWQAGDGQSNAIFYDGVTSRRSQGPSVMAGTIDGTGFTVGAIGTTSAIVLLADYTGVFPVTVDICGTLWKLIGKTGNLPHDGFGVTVTNNDDTAGATVPTGTTAVIDTGFLGLTSVGFVLVGNNPFPTVSQVALDRPVFTPSFSGLEIRFFNADGQVGVFKRMQLGNYSAGITPVASGVSKESNDHTFAAGSPVRLSSGTVTQLGTIVAFDPNVPNTGFTVPAIGASTTIYLSQAYTGTLPQQIFIGNRSYTITAIVPSLPPGGDLKHLDAVNINDTTTGANKHANCDIFTLAEISPGRMGAYGMGRNWYSLPDGISFRATDIVGSSSGTSAENFRDAVLKEAHNQFLTTGDFRLPGANGAIRAMRFISILDRSLGQGPLEVLTPSIVFSCDAPVNDLIWQDLTNPILTETLKPKGGLGQNSTVNANSDLFFRASDGLRSLILGQRQFSTWGNVAQSAEVSPTLDADDQTILQYSSAINFDNRLLMTAHPIQGPNGVYHDLLVAINFDPISSLQGKAPSVWDGVWNGLNALQLVSGEFQSLERAFAFCFNPATGKNELWEILRSADPAVADSGGQVTWEIQSGSLFKKDKEFKQLADGEIRVDQLVGTVTFQAFYKPDQWPDWVPWTSWTETHTGTGLGFRPRMGLGQPKATDIDSENDRPLRNFFTMQFRLVITGHCRFLGARFLATTQPQPKYATPR